MFSSLRKWMFGLIVVGVVIFLGILGFNLYINYQAYTFKRAKEEERMKKQKEQADKEQLEKDVLEAQKNALADWSPKGKGEILRIENIDHLGILNNEAVKCLKCNSCKDCEEGDECLEMHPRLIFSDRVNEYIRNVLENTVRLVNKQQRGLSSEELESDGYNDNTSRYLKRYNAVLYGAPGTGKTELVNELVHHLFEKFNNPKIKSLKKEIVKLEKELELAKKKKKEIGKKSGDTLTEEEKQKEERLKKHEKKLDEKEKELKKIEKANRIPPVFKIDGASLQTGGETLGQPNPEQKLIKIIAMLKEEAFDGDVFSNEPYIVFVEEADQGKNVLTADKGKLLEEYKNFLSTSQDKAGLRAKAQDPNSIIIIATNNFADIDPAVFRRGRLGTRLNFNWTPALLEKYGNQSDSEWEKIYWPKNDPGWQFIGNTNYQDLYLLTSRFGYSKFADELTCKTSAKLNNPKIVSKANQIIESYKALMEEEKEIKEKELGFFITGKKIMVKNDKGEDKEENEKICNWLLHFLYTFHDYNDREDLNSFINASQIIPYNFGEAFNTQQTIKGVTGQIGELVTVMNITKNIEAEVAKDIKNISKLMIETSSVQDQFREVQDKVNEVIRDMSSDRDSFNNSLKVLENNIQRISNNSGGISGDLNTLSSRLSALENKVAGLGSGSSSSSSGSGGISVSKVNNLGGKINILQDKLNKLITVINNSGNSSSALSELRTALNELLDGYNAI